MIFKLLKSLFVGSDSSNEINVSTNVIIYPTNIICKCGNKVDISVLTIDSSTWDIICPCGNVAYVNPKRNDRIVYLNNILK